MSKAETYTHFEPACPWLDLDGNPIRAHGGGILSYKGNWFWFGECRNEFVSFPGITCYVSSDLLRWKYLGLALSPVETPDSPLHPGRIVERAKVLFNAKTGKFVMWAHAETSDYAHAHALVAISDRPEGPYNLVHEFRPGGSDFRDMNLFRDENGCAYVIYSSENNHTLHIDLLSDDYLDTAGQTRRALIGEHREAPVMFKHADKYWLLTSGTTGFSPNRLAWASADAPLGEWINGGDPCKGEIGAESGFHSQPFSVVPMPGAAGAFIYFGDHWSLSSAGLSGSTFVPLPLCFEDGIPRIRWHNRWNPTDRPTCNYTENPRGPEIEIPEVGTSGSLTREGKPQVVFSTGSSNPSALVWLGWDSSALYCDVLVFDSGEDHRIDSERPVWKQTSIELFVNYFQIAIAADSSGSTLIAGGTGLDDSLSGLGNVDPRLMHFVKVRYSRGISSTYSTLLGFAPSHNSCLYSVKIDRQFAALPEFALGDHVAMAFTVKSKAFANSTLLSASAPAKYRWADTDSFFKGITTKPSSLPDLELLTTA